MTVRALLGWVFVAWLTACASAVETEVPQSTPSTVNIATHTVVPTSTARPLAPSVTPPNTTTPMLAPTLTPAPTPDPYAGLSITELAARRYGGGELTIKQGLGSNSAFTRSLITFPSDGLTIYGFMNAPHGSGPFPVVLVLHGYVSPTNYNTLTYTTRYADTLARAGYLVIHPNLRGYPPSDEGANPFRIGYAVDVLNLIAIVRAQGGKPGPLRAADANAIGLWGHSMGGGVSVRVITVSPDVKAAVLYGSMSGDERKNIERLIFWTGGLCCGPERSASAEIFAQVSPINFLERVTAAVSIHHGQSDAVVPFAWSAELCDKLRALRKSVECFPYPDQPHTFVGDGEALFNQRVIGFFDRQLKQK